MGFSIMSFVEFTYNIVLNFKCKKQTNDQLVGIKVDDNKSATSEKTNETVIDNDCDQDSIDIIIESFMNAPLKYN